MIRPFPHLQTVHFTRPALLALAAAAALAQGCASSSTGVRMGDDTLTHQSNPAPRQRTGSASSSAAVLLPSGTARLLGDDDPASRPEFSRRDEALAVVYEGPITASDQWPEVQRPSLDDARLLTLYTDPREVTFFSPPTNSPPYGGRLHSYLYTGPYWIGH